MCNKKKHENKTIKLNNCVHHSGKKKPVLQYCLQLMTVRTVEDELTVTAEPNGIAKN